MTIVVITGDSHCAALKHGYDGLKHKPKSVEVRFQPLGGGLHVPTPFFAAQPDKMSVKIVCPRWQPREFPDPDIDHRNDDVVYALSMPLNTSRILRDFPWGHFVPWLLRQGDERALSDRLLQEILWADVKYAVQFTAALVEAGLRVVVVEAPHFFSDSPYLRRSRLEVCRFVSDAYRTLVRSELASRGVPVIGQPESTLDENGCTRLQYHTEKERDFHHGNAVFGTIMMEALLKYVVSSSSSAGKAVA